MVELDFEQPGQAEGFLAKLQTTVWNSPDVAPALLGAPKPGSWSPHSKTAGAFSELPLGKRQRRPHALRDGPAPASVMTMV